MTQDTILHQFNDPSHKYLVKRLREAPAYAELVKFASLDPDTVEDMSDHAFAWPEQRLFPIDTEDNASLSWVYVEKNAAVPDYVKDEIQKALEIYDVTLPTVETQKVAHVEERHYLLPSIKRWLVTDASTVKLAAARLADTPRDMSLSERTEAAVNLYNCAEELGAEEHIDNSSIAKMAGMTASNISSVQEWLEARSGAAPTQHKQRYMKMAEALNQVERICYDRNALVKLASSIYDLDVESGLSTLYGKTLLDPMYTVFNTDKRAESTLDMGGTEVPLSKMMTVPVEYYEDVFGDDIAPEITSGGDLDPTKLATVINTMPRDLKVIFRKQLGF